MMKPLAFTRSLFSIGLEKKKVRYFGGPRVRNVVEHHRQRNLTDFTLRKTPIYSSVLLYYLRLLPKRENQGHAWSHDTADLIVLRYTLYAINPIEGISHPTQSQSISPSLGIHFLQSMKKEGTGKNMKLGAQSMRRRLCMQRGE